MAATLWAAFGRSRPIGFSRGQLETIGGAVHLLGASNVPAAKAREIRFCQRPPAEIRQWGAHITGLIFGEAGPRD